MNLKDILNQKQNELNKMNEELKKIDDYRLKLMSMTLKTTGAIDLLAAMLDQEQKDAKKDEKSETSKTPETPNAKVVDSAPTDTEKK